MSSEKRSSLASSKHKKTENALAAEMGQGLLYRWTKYSILGMSNGGNETRLDNFLLDDLSRQLYQICIQLWI